MKAAPATPAAGIVFSPQITCAARQIRIATPSIRISQAFGLILMLGVAILIFRAAQVFCGLKTMPAAGVAGAAFIVLVVVPNALYMLLLFLPSAYRVILAQQATFLEELMAAGRGVFALLIGDRRAGTYFDFSQRGLVGSFIAFLAVTGLNAVLPAILGSKEPGGITRSILMIAILFGLQLAFSAIVLRQLKRMDGLVPYLVADNWATFFLTLISGALAAAGIEGDAVLIVLAIIVIVIEVNIARLIVTLTPLQIAMFLIA